MERMPDLVYGTFLTLFQGAVWLESVFLEEETNLVAGIEEVVVA